MLINMKCYNYYAKQNLKCYKKECRYWINCSSEGNCCITASSKSNKTLEDIGKIYGITRMRVCQIEKKIIQKIKKRVLETLS
jgi:hypothetical protein